MPKLRPGCPAESHHEGQHRATEAPCCAQQGQVGEEDHSGQKAPKGAKTAKPAKKEAGPREGSKAEKVLELLKRPNGATIKELMKATGWRPHSVRGYLSGTVSKKMGLALTSTKAEDGERSYSVKA